MSNVLMLCLISGQEILGDVINDSDGTLTVKEPVMLQLSPGTKPGEVHIQMQPALPLGTNKQIELNKLAIAYAYTPAEPVLDKYNQTFGSGLVLPSSKLIQP